MDDRRTTGRPHTTAPLWSSQSQCRPFVRSPSHQARLEALGQLWQHLVQVADHAEVGVLEDRRALVLVDRDDHLGVADPDEVLYLARDTDCDVQLGLDRGPRYPQIPFGWHPVDALDRKST